MTGAPTPQASANLKSKLRGIIQILRPELPLAAGLCVVLGELLALGALPTLHLLAWGFVCGFFLSASALVVNDYFDFEVDRINAPHRPLPAGLLSPVEVMALGLLTALIGLIAAWVFNPVTIMVALIVWIFGFLYNWKLKAAGLWGNLIVSASVAMTFILGGIGVGQVWNPIVWTFGLIAFFFDLAEEIAGDAMDAEGDQKRGSKSVAIIYGRQFAIRLSCTLFGVVIMLSFLPIAWGDFALRYLLTLLPMDFFIVFFAFRLFNSQTPTEGRWSMRGLYLSASLGLLAFLLSAFFV